MDRDLRPGTRSLVLELAIKNYGGHVRSLELAWSRPYLGNGNGRSYNVNGNDSARERRIARSELLDAGAEFLGAVRCQGVQLVEIALTDWVHSRKWGNCAKLLFQLANLLACQRNLKSLSLLNANMMLKDALRLLVIVAKVSGPRLASLDLRGAFRDWQTPYCCSRYARVIGRLRALSHLSLDYTALSERTLDALAAGASRDLRTLQVYVRDSDDRQHRVGDSAWRNLALACPHLAVSYSVVNIWHYDELRHFLMPSVPLAKFQMYGNSPQDQSRTRNFRGTLGLLVDQYAETLAEVMLQLRNNREMLDDLIIAMLSRCKRLRHLQYDGIMRNLETVREICQLQADRKTRFRSIHLKPKNVSLRNRALLQDIDHQFHRKMSNGGIDFRVEDAY